MVVCCLIDTFQLTAQISELGRAQLVEAYARNHKEVRMFATRLSTESKFA
jgi:hypothetical protein